MKFCVRFITMKQYAYAFSILLGLITGTSLLFANENDQERATAPLDESAGAVPIHTSYVDPNTVRVGENYRGFVVTSVEPTKLSAPYDRKHNITIGFSTYKKITGILREGEETLEGLYWVEVDPEFQNALPSTTAEPVTKLIPTGGDGVFRKHGPNTHVEIIINQLTIVNGREPLPYTTITVAESKLAN
jgi:hypothetical protein